MLATLRHHRALPPERVARHANLSQNELEQALSHLSRAALVVTQSEAHEPWIAITRDGDQAIGA